MSCHGFGVVFFGFDAFVFDLDFDFFFALEFQFFSMFQDVLYVFH